MQEPVHKNEQKPNHSILTQNKLSSPSKIGLAKIKLRWFFVALLLSIFGVAAAFSPTLSNEHIKLHVRSVAEEIALPLPINSINHDAAFWQIDQVRPNDTLNSLFKRMTIQDEDAFKFLMFNPQARVINTKLVPGRTFKIRTNSAGKLLHLKYELDASNIAVMTATPGGYQVETQALELQSHSVLKSATIVDSLFGATDNAGIPDQIALQLAEILSGEIDFHKDLRPNDQLYVIYEAFYHDGELMKTGKVLALEFVNKGKKYQAVHFGESKGKHAYYTPEGKSLHKSFLRSPLEFTRISSSFSTGRFHPILNRIKAHRGVDMAAPSGTRIRASGDGVVNFVGRKGGYGNVIILKHKNNITTLYGHLQRAAKGLRRGKRVSQGEIIGFVGMTGLATGPHLHYEFLVGKVHRDPMKVALPTSLPMDAKDKPQFAAISANYMAQMELLNRSQVASLE